jgi:hypothetical protein
MVLPIVSFKTKDSDSTRLVLQRQFKALLKPFLLVFQSSTDSTMMQTIIVLVALIGRIFFM